MPEIALHVGEAGLTLLVAQLEKKRVFEIKHQAGRENMVERAKWGN